MQRPASIRVLLRYRFFSRSVLFASAILFVASSASALTTFNVTTDRGSNIPYLNPGDTLTIFIRLSGGTNVFGLGASAWGYNESVIDFTSGEAVSSINHAVAIPAVGFFSGLTNSLVPASPVPGTVASGALSESAIGPNGNRVSFFSGVGLAGTNTNSADPGLNGSATDAQFRLVFTVVGPGDWLINIGTGYAGDGEVGPGGSLDQSANVQIRPVPEPGTALLLGLGLSALAAGRLRRRSHAR